MASYRLEVDERVQKDLRRISGDIAPRIWEKIKLLGHEPFPAASTKLVGSLCSYRLRVGDYRVLYFVLSDERRVVINRVLHRREAYR